jgi:hypothetical protein
VCVYVYVWVCVRVCSSKRPRATTTERTLDVREQREVVVRLVHVSRHSHGGLVMPTCLLRQQGESVGWGRADKERAERERDREREREREREHQFDVVLAVLCVCEQAAWMVPHTPTYTQTHGDTDGPSTPRLL